MDLTQVIQFKPRYVVRNDGPKPILIAQDGFQQDARFVKKLAPGQSMAMHAEEAASADDKETDGKKDGRKLRGGQKGGRLFTRSGHLWHTRRLETTFFCYPSPM
jgi:hypothetical protein